MAQYTKRDEVALQVINLAKAEILGSNHFLAAALGRLLTEPVALGKSLSASGQPAQFTTDGERLGFDAGSIINRFSATGGQAPTHDLLHTVIHCTFLHPFVGKRVDPDQWNLACDIAAERVVAEILGPRGDGRGKVQADVIRTIETDMGGRADAERIYAGLNRGRWRNMVPFWEMLFFSDEHGTWYLPPDVGEGLGEGESDLGTRADHANVRGPEGGSHEKHRGKSTPPKKADPDRRPDPNDVGGGDQNVDPGADTRDPGIDDRNKEQQYVPAADAAAPEQPDSREGSAAPDKPVDDPPTAHDPEKVRTGGGDVSPRAHRASKDPTPRGAGDGHSLNDDADAPGEVPSAGSPEARAQGEGEGTGQESYISERRGLGLASVQAARRDRLREEWRNVSTSLAVNLETYAREHKSSLSGFCSDLDATGEPPVDYRKFLRQFAALGEVMHLSDDEFDNVFYTYGLRVFGNVPLIEPLETREERRIREFVIVIDTSGSVRGDIVRAFVDATFDVLKNTESFHEKVNLRILQCDATVQTDDKIESLDQINAWSRSMRIFGGGGTDFRPAFTYVDELIGAGEFHHLGGLVYFTDGWGTYPEWCPPYPTAFVFYDDNHRRAQVPPWAISAVLDRMSIEHAAQSDRTKVERASANTTRTSSGKVTGTVGSATDRVDGTTYKVGHATETDSSGNAARSASHHGGRSNAPAPYPTAAPSRPPRPIAPPPNARQP